MKKEISDQIYGVYQSPLDAKLAPVNNVSDLVSIPRAHRYIGMTIMVLNKDIDEDPCEYWLLNGTRDCDWVKKTVGSIDLSDYSTTADTRNVVNEAVTELASELQDYVESAVTQIEESVEEDEEVIARSIGKLNDKIEIDERVTAFALNELNSRFEDYYTSAQTDSAITLVIENETARTEECYSKTGHTHSNYVTSGDVQTQITSAITEISQYCLPQVSSTDNGKILQVVNGVWTLVVPNTIYSGSGTPDDQDGNNGDIYIQTE